MPNLNCREIIDGIKARLPQTKSQIIADQDREIAQLRNKISQLDEILDEAANEHLDYPDHVQAEPSEDELARIRRQLADPNYVWRF